MNGRPLPTLALVLLLFQPYDHRHLQREGQNERTGGPEDVRRHLGTRTAAATLLPPRALLLQILLGRRWGALPRLVPAPCLKILSLAFGPGSLAVPTEELVGRCGLWGFRGLWGYLLDATSQAAEATTALTNSHVVPRWAGPSAPSAPSSWRQTTTAPQPNLNSAHQTIPSLASGRAASLRRWGCS